MGTNNQSWTVDTYTPNSKQFAVRVSIDTTTLNNRFDVDYPAFEQEVEDIVSKAYDVLNFEPSEYELVEECKEQNGDILILTAIFKNEG